MSLKSIATGLLAPFILIACGVGTTDGDAESNPEGIGTTTQAITVTIGPISDESSRNSGRCPAQQGVYGMECTGRYCDNVYLFCDHVRSDVVLDTIHTWQTAWFSEEQSGNFANCDTAPAGIGTSRPGIVTGVRCRGDYCDAMSLDCTPLLSGAIGSHLSEWGTFSDEDPAQTWNARGYGDTPLTGLQCSGRYCDNLKATTRAFFPYHD